MDSDDITSLCASLSIDHRDGPVQILNDQLMVKDGMEIESVSGNTFTFHFHNIQDLERVLAGGRWSFDSALIAMEIPVGKGTIGSLSFNQADFWIQIHQVPLLCMTREIGQFLGGLIGMVIDVDGGASGDCVGKFMRVRVQVDISRALKRCLRVDILGDGLDLVNSQI
ncbi:hypothetical protein EZV62_004792 [Acer yangbiense]|uniref:Uncharacterized protein n=1 Tax=Acer yangbiense TaxID=1000413 RepID=A0A5C7IKC9_9ROSI|nr:hypothetical protein EZV62_004792 [Acer yangbiense]